MIVFSLGKTYQIEGLGSSLGGSEGLDAVGHAGVLGSLQCRRLRSRSGSLSLHAQEFTVSSLSIALSRSILSQDS